MKVEICFEGIAEIVRQDLREMQRSLEDDLKKRKKGTQLAIFHMDEKKDIAELQRHIEAFKIVAKYYGAI